MKIGSLLIIASLITGCSPAVQHPQPKQQIQHPETTTISSNGLTAEQQQMLLEMQAHVRITNQLTQSCKLVADGLKDEALASLKKIDWSNSEVKISTSGVDYDGIINFFVRQPNFQKESCSEYASALYRDSIS